jgi:hypothetical protein
MHPSLDLLEVRLCLALRCICAQDSAVCEVLLCAYVCRASNDSNVVQDRF